MSLRGTCIASVLVEFEAGYIFTPYGEYGDAYLVARSSSSLLVSTLSVLCVSVWPVIALIVMAGLYSRVVHNIMPFIAAAGIGLAWIAAFALWAAVMTRGLIKVSRHAR